MVFLSEQTTNGEVKLFNIYRLSFQQLRYARRGFIHTMVTLKGVGSNLPRTDESLSILTLFLNYF